MTRSKSKYDELHDRFFTILSTKAGTRYERLAALVFKRLHEQHAVIHDFKLIGASKVKHQIDVLLEIDGKSRRVLVECKDFDKAGKPVGLGIIRNFWAVIEDTHADEAFVVTCTRYTPPARRYATAKGIKRVRGCRLGRVHKKRQNTDACRERTSDRAFGVGA
jgi:Restriction endonuclease